MLLWIVIAVVAAVVVYAIVVFNRLVPQLFRDASGRVREVTFNLIGVYRDGNPEPYHTERTHGVIRIYAGDKEVLIRPGEHTYVFEYRTARQIRWFDGKPELNWNATGNFWRFPTERATSGRRCTGRIPTIATRCGTISQAGAAAAAGRATTSAVRLPRPSAACRARWPAQCRCRQALRALAAAAARAVAAVVVAAAGSSRQVTGSLSPC